TGLNRGTMLLDVWAARFAHRGDFHERRLAWPSQALEMDLDTMRQPLASRLGRSAMADDVAITRLYDLRVLTVSGGRGQQHKSCEGEKDCSHQQASIDSGVGIRVSAMCMTVR